MSDVSKVIDIASSRAVADHWVGRLGRSSEGGIQASASNAAIIMANDPAIAGSLSFNDFTGTPLLTRPLPPAENSAKELPGPYPRPWGPADVVLMLAYLQRVYSHRFAKGTAEDAMIVSAEQNRFHPVRDWLDELRWDGVPRLDKWLVNAFGCEHTALHSAVGAKFLIAAVRRVRQPGCKFDNMLVLEGRQNLGKSKAWATLFGEEWFSDDIPKDLGHKDAPMALMGKWCLEFAELASLIKNDDETAKAFISRQTDRYRPPYGKNFVERPRQGVLCGTTNEDDWLRDPTGNRRYWPVYCVTADCNWISINRDQLWAEASQREADGEAIWLDDHEVAEEAKQAQEKRVVGEVWEDQIFQFLTGKSEIQVSEILSTCLGFTPDKMNRGVEMRVARSLKLLKWKREVRWVGGKTRNIWVPEHYDLL